MMWLLNKNERCGGFKCAKRENSRCERRLLRRYCSWGQLTRSRACPRAIYYSGAQGRISRFLDEVFCRWNEYSQYNEMIEDENDLRYKMCLVKVSWLIIIYLLFIYIFIRLVSSVRRLFVIMWENFISDIMMILEKTWHSNIERSWTISIIIK